MGKVCCACKTDKPEQDFSKASHRNDGLSSKCRECTAIYKKNYAASAKGKAKIKARSLARDDAARYAEVKDNPLTKYRAQRSHAKERGIQWGFTYESWVKWWGDDLAKRGNAAGDLCCCRYGDMGAYSSDNCYKDTISNNALAGQAKRHPTCEHLTSTHMSSQ